MACTKIRQYQVNMAASAMPSASEGLLSLPKHGDSTSRALTLASNDESPRPSSSDPASAGGRRRAQSLSACCISGTGQEETRGEEGRSAGNDASQYRPG